MSITVTAPFNPETGEEYTPDVSNENMVETLREALALMEDGHWAQRTGHFVLPDGSVAWCSVAAVSRIIGRLHPFAAIGELLRTLGEGPEWIWREGIEEPYLNYQPLIDFNDAPGRTFTEVKSLFESTIERLEK